MRAMLAAAALLIGFAESGRTARCTTSLDPQMLREYQDYVFAAEQGMDRRFGAGNLSWVPASSRKEANAKLASCKQVRRNISDASVNERIAARNATVLHWVGAIRIPGVSLAELQAVLEDFERYDRMYRPMITEFRAKGVEEAPGFDVILGLQSSFRFASLFPQHYAFRVHGNLERARGNGALSLHLRAREIRESDSGVAGRNDFLETYHDHGIMWALNAYWRARPMGTDVYLEFETITLARSVQAFSCRLGIVPVPKSVVAEAMDSIPADSVTVILEGTRAECARRASVRR